MKKAKIYIPTKTAMQSGLAKNNKWIIATSLVCVLLGVLTFFAFINKQY